MASPGQALGGKEKSTIRFFALEAKRGNVKKNLQNKLNVANQRQREREKVGAKKPDEPPEVVNSKKRLYTPSCGVCGREREMAGGYWLKSIFESVRERERGVELGKKYRTKWSEQSPQGKQMRLEAQLQYKRHEFGPVFRRTKQKKKGGPERKGVLQRNHTQTGGKKLKKALEYQKQKKAGNFDVRTAALVVKLRVSPI